MVRAVRPLSQTQPLQECRHSPHAAPKTHTSVIGQHPITERPQRFLRPLKRKPPPLPLRFGECFLFSALLGGAGAPVPCSFCAALYAAAPVFLAPLTV